MNKDCVLLHMNRHTKKKLESQEKDLKACHVLRDWQLLYFSGLFSVKKVGHYKRAMVFAISSLHQFVTLLMSACLVIISDFMC